MITIDSQLRKYFIIVIVVSVLVIFTLSNLGMAFFFNNYVQQSYLKSDVKIVDYIEDMILQEDGFTMAHISGLIQMVRGEEAEIKIFNSKGELVLDTMAMGNGMMGRGGMMGGMMGSQNTAEDLVFEEYPLKPDGSSIGTVEIGRKKTIISSAQDRDFFLTMNLVFVIALVVSILLALYISKYVTNKFLQPLLAVKQNIEAIAKKNHKESQPVLSNTKEIQELARATEELSQSLNEQEKLRKRLTSDVAHELRTPLATLQSHMEAMIDGVWEPTVQRLSHCNDEIIRLTRLINDLNQLTGIESDTIQLNKKPVNLSDLLMTLMDNYKLIFQDKSILVEEEIVSDIVLYGDIDRLKQIFGNVLSNAYKYSGENGYVKIALTVQHDTAVVKIQDRGIGIKAEDLPHIFERFYRGDVSRSRKSGGTGIGLTIAKALTEAHHGTMEIESEIGKGTTVIVSLPIQLEL